MAEFQFFKGAAGIETIKASNAWGELLYILHRELTENELDNVKLIVKDRMKRKDYEGITTTKDLLLFLEKTGFISENDVVLLREVFKAANLNALCNELDSYEAFHKKIRGLKMAMTKREDVNEFVGREEEVGRIIQLLEENETSPSLAVFITGPGGIGKTELAIEVCVRMEAIVGVRAKRVELRGLKTSEDVFLKLANEVFDSDNPIRKKDLNDDVLQKRMRQFCFRHREVIILLDNADDILLPDGPGRNKLHGQREQFFNQLGGLIKSNIEQGRINFIVTSRYKISKIEHFKEISLENLTDEASVSFLYKSSSHIERDEAKNIAKLCGNNSLALTLIASRFRGGNMAAADIINLLQSKQAMGLLDRSGEGSVKHTLQTTFEMLDADKQVKLSKLSVFTGSFDQVTAAAVLGLNNPAIAQMIIDDLIKWNLVNKMIDFDEITPEKRVGVGRYNLHLLIRTFLKELGPLYENIGNKVFKEASTAFVQYFDKELRREAKISLNINFAQSRLFLEKEKANLIEYAKLSVELGITPSVKRIKDQDSVYALYNFISDLFQKWKARANYFKALAEKSKNVDVLAYCFLKTMEADQHFSANNVRSVEKILAGPSQTLEELSKTDNSPGVRLALAALYYVKGRYLVEKGEFFNAISFLTKSLETRQKLFSLNIITVHTLDTLGIAYQRFKHYDKALEYYTQALDMARRLNSHHPDFPMILTNIGNCHLEKGDKNTNSRFFDQARKSYDTAISFYLEAIKSEKEMKIFSLTHRTAYVLKSKAQAHIALEQYDVALDLAEEALNISREKLDPEHREIGRSLFLVGHIYFRKGLKKYVKKEEQLAQEFFEKGLGYLKEAFNIEVKLGRGCRTNNYRLLMDDLARTLRVLGRKGEAEDYERQFAEAEKVLQPEYLSSSNGSSSDDSDKGGESYKSTSTSASEEDEDEKMETT